MALNSIYRMSVVGAYQDQQIVNTFHFQQDTATLPGGRSGPDEIVSRWLSGGGSLQNSYLALLTNKYTITELNIINEKDPFDNVTRQVSGTGSGGSGDVLPSQCCALLSLRTGGRGRSFRGRTYIGPLVEDAQVDGTITLFFQSKLNTFAVNMVATFGAGSGLDWRVYSRKLGTASSINRVIERSFIATQRRRSKYNPG